MRKVKSWKNKLYSMVNLKENVEIVAKLGTSHFSARIVRTTMVEKTETETEPEIFFACTVANWAIIRRVASSSRRRNLKTAMSVILAVALSGETTSYRCGLHGDFDE
jgi:hypothetical protein